MRLHTKVGLAATTVAAVLALPAGPAGAQIICVQTTQSLGEVCTNQVLPYAQSRVDCVAADPAAAAGCLPRITRLP